MFLNNIRSSGVLLIVCIAVGGSVGQGTFSTYLDTTKCEPVVEGTTFQFELKGTVSGSYTIVPSAKSARSPEDFSLPSGLTGRVSYLFHHSIRVDIIGDGNPEEKKKSLVFLAIHDQEPPAVPNEIEVSEGPEAFTLTFTAVGFTPLEVPFCIIDTDTAPLSFSAAAKTCVKESLSPLVIRIRRPSSDTIAMNAAVTYSDGDAVTTSDYDNSVRTLAFLNEERNAYLEVPITDDLVVESPEEFSITIRAPGYDPITIKGCINDDDSTVPFNCNRYGVTCAAGRCPPGGTKCDCSTAPDRTGDNCGIIESKINGTGCAGMNCGRNGRCVSNGTVGECVCNSGYYSGDEGKCELKRTTITSCNNNTMTICMNPINTYQPLITVSGYTSNRCTAELVGNITDSENRIPSEIQGQCLTVGFSGRCGTYTATPQDDGNVCNTIPYRIQYNPNFIAASDEVVYAKCCVNLAGQTISTEAILADTATRHVNKQREDLTFLGVTLSVLLDNGRAIDSPIPLNQIYELCLVITDEGFQYLGLTRIIVHNGESGSSRKEAVVYGTDGCSDEEGKAMVQSYPRRVSDKKICMKYKPGYFRPGPAAVIHEMIYKLCLAGDQAACQLARCGVTGGRKKRQTNSGAVEATANATVYFEDESTSASQTNTDTEVSPVSKDCLPEMSVMFPAIIAVCVVTLVLIIVIVYMCFLLMKKRRKQEDKQDELKSEKSRKPYPYRY